MDEAKENEKLDLPREEYEPVVSQPVELAFLGTEISLCVFDIHGDREVKTCYGDICKIVDALRDYSRLLKMVCKTWNLQGFHRAKYEFYPYCPRFGRLFPRFLSWWPSWPWPPPPAGL